MRTSFLRHLSVWARRVFLPVSIASAWAAVSTARLVDPIFLPSPTDLWDSYVALAPSLPSALRATLTMIAAGFVIGVAVGLGLALVMAYSKLALDVLGATFEFLRPVPIFAAIPLFILWFGIGRSPQIAFIASGIAVIIGVVTQEAIRNVPPVYVRAAYTLGATKAQIYRRAIAPFIVPHLVGGIRVAAAASFGLDVAAEFIGSQNGLGSLLIIQEQYLNTAGVIDLVILFSALAIAFDLVLRLAERHVTRWTYRRSAESGTFGIPGG